MLVRQPPHVGGLVVLRRARPRHQDRRSGRDRDLGDRARPAAPDQQVRRRVGQLDAVVEADHLMEHPGRFRRHGRDGREEPVADDLADRQRRVRPVGLDVADHRVVEGTRPQRPSGDHDHESVRRQPQFAARGVPIACAVDVEDAPPYGRSRHLRARQARVRECHCRRGGEAGCQGRRPPGSAVVAHDHDRHTEPPRGEHRREAGVPADRHDDPGAQATNERDRLPARGQEPGHHRHVHPEVVSGEPPLQADDVEEGVRVRRRAQQRRLDPPPGADVVDLVRRVAGRDERLGDGERRQHVPRRPPTRHDREGHLSGISQLRASERQRASVQELRRRQVAWPGNAVNVTSGLGGPR